MANREGFLGRSYLTSLSDNYPELVNERSIDSVDNELHVGIIKKWRQSADILGIDSKSRFQSLEERSFSSLRNAWTSAADCNSENGLRRLAASSSYKGLIHLKPPCDVVLYSSLIWELQPATIIEFGALQGGSALWLADQMDACHLDGEVHSFELLDKCIHPSASHRRLHFHQVDLNDISSLDSRMFSRLPHPWLVIDDAHTNLVELMPYVGGFLECGDYYVIEDVLLFPPPDVVVAWVQLCHRLRLLVDTKYTDAFGYNVTCSPNGWLQKF
jgi:cephalosporin hydroxylase